MTRGFSIAGLSWCIPGAEGADPKRILPKLTGSGADDLCVCRKAEYGSALRARGEVLELQEAVDANAYLVVNRRILDVAEGLMNQHGQPASAVLVWDGASTGPRCDRTVWRGRSEKRIRADRTTHTVSDAQQDARARRVPICRHLISGCINNTSRRIRLCR